jgi:hypothetical protein
LLKHDYTRLEAAVPRSDSPFKVYVHKTNFQLPRSRNLAVVSRLSKPIFLCDAASIHNRVQGWSHRDKERRDLSAGVLDGVRGIVSKRLNAPYRSGRRGTGSG